VADTSDYRTGSRRHHAGRHRRLSGDRRLRLLTIPSKFID
jgi:hypothetical protein